ncbi:MAG: hypothetical protein AAF488_12285 [Planctomycetota bacterium]
MNRLGGLMKVVERLKELSQRERIIALSTTFVLLLALGAWVASGTDASGTDRYYEVEVQVTGSETGVWSSVRLDAVFHGLPGVRDVFAAADQGRVVVRFDAEEVSADQIVGRLVKNEYAITLRGPVAAVSRSTGGLWRVTLDAPHYKPGQSGRAVITGTGASGDPAEIEIEAHPAVELVATTVSEGTDVEFVVGEEDERAWIEVSIDDGDRVHVLRLPLDPTPSTAN